MILIGSRALNYYIPLDRVMHDWDILMTRNEFSGFDFQYSEYLVKNTKASSIYDINGQIVEVINPESWEDTDKQLLQSRHENYIDSEFGTLCIPSIQILFDIKLATANHIDEPKHKHDMHLIEQHFNIEYKTKFFIERNAEIEHRVAKSNKVMYDFFHKYHIPEYVLHDRLHDMISDLLDQNMPTYKRITVAETDISEELFNKLTHNQKVSLMVEESLVLNLERWFIPQMIEKGINHRLIDMFYNNNEAMPTYKILKHVNLTGLKGEAKYITDFGKANFFEIELMWQIAKKIIKGKGGFPSSFFNELFKLREDFKQGKQVGYHHKSGVDSGKTDV